MKYIKRILLLLLVLLLLVVVFNYRKLNIIAGYVAKNNASSIYLAKRSLEFTNSTDVSLAPLNITNNTNNETEKTASSSVLGLLTRKAIYREGVGSVLITNDDDISSDYLVPKRTAINAGLEFPYGDKNHKDTLFSTVDYKKLNSVVDTMFDADNQTRAVLVIHKDKIIAEKYGDNFNKDSRLLGWSMTKSVMSSVFGVLEYQGKLKTTDNNLFKEWENDDRKEITINNLLQMNSGLAWEEEYTSICDATEMLFLEKDMSKVQLNKSLVGKPNESWSYSSGTSNLLSGLLRSYFKTHQEYLDFWYSDLIDKIGMHSMVVETDLAGNYVGSSYGWATARDWSKLGLLYLHKGDWNGTTIFDKEWVNYTTKPTNSSNNLYGAQVWLNAGGVYPDVPKSLYSFNGHQGQYVFILPEQDLVIVRLGLTKNADLNQFLKGVVAAVDTGN